MNGIIWYPVMLICQIGVSCNEVKYTGPMPQTKAECQEKIDLVFNEIASKPEYLKPMSQPKMWVGGGCLMRGDKWKYTLQEGVGNFGPGRPDKDAN